MSWQGVAVNALFFCLCFLLLPITAYYCRSPHTRSKGWHMRGHSHIVHTEREPPWALGGGPLPPEPGKKTI